MTDNIQKSFSFTDEDIIDIIYPIVNSLKIHSTRNAIYCEEKLITYNDLGKKISAIRKIISGAAFEDQINIGIVTTIDENSYASIIALWLEGKTYVPINPTFPADRNLSILEQSDIKTILGSLEEKIFEKFACIDLNNLEDVEINLVPKIVKEDTVAYILFTSGTTGLPKGVPITRSNLSNFAHSMYSTGYLLTENDKCLQMFELTFDLSVMAYVLPFMHGACIYLVPSSKIKFSYIYELLEYQKLSAAPMIPSILHFFKKYFSELSFPDLKYSVFCGEALQIAITKEWSNCIPNAEIINYYGPTENTIYSTYYNFQRNGNNKQRNGILSIGKAMVNTDTIIVDTDDKITGPEEIGELCLSGRQLTPGYLRNELKNKNQFFYKKIGDENIRFYRSGDLCIKDSECDILYLGRLDSQIKIQGYRIELSEIEHHAKQIMKDIQVAVVVYEKVKDTAELGLAIEGEVIDINGLVFYLKSKMPAYMQPAHIKFCKTFPLNLNGKTDKNKLKELFI